MSHPHLVHPNALESATLARMAHHNDLVDVSAAGTLPTSGLVRVVGGTGFALALPKPKIGDKIDITLASITSGAVVVTTAAGSTFDGTNNTATFNAASDRLVAVYEEEGEWEILTNTSVALSAV